MQHHNLQHILCSDAQEGGKYFYLKKVQKHTKSKMAAYLRGNSRWPLFFVKIVYVLTDPQMYRSFESIKNLQRFDFFKDICNSRGKCAP